MTPLRQCFIDDMRLRNRAARTIDTYVSQVAGFARHFGRSPELLGAKEVREFQLHLLGRRVSWSSFNQAVCALRLLYRTKPGRPLNGSNLQRRFSQLVKQLGLTKHCSMHTLRHSYATHLLEAGVDLLTLKALLGHTSLQTTARYLHISTQRLMQAPSLLDLLVLPQGIAPPGNRAEGRP